MTLKSLFVRILFALVAPASIPTCLGENAPTAWEQSVRLGTGINLGNIFDAPDGEGTWSPHRVQPADFDHFKTAGFNHVRLPVTWANHFSKTAPYDIDRVFMDRIAEVVSWATKSGLVVVLTAQHEEWFKKDPAGQGARLDSLWHQIALRFRDSPDENLVFEFMNESEKEHITHRQTIEMNERLLGIVRKVSPTRCVILGAVGDNADFLVEHLEVPSDPYVLATYHCYDPWFFVCGEPRNEEEARWGNDRQKREYLSLMDRVKAWSGQHRVPVYLGEWGTSVKCDRPSRLEYYRFVAREARRRGFCQAIWDDGGGMMFFDRARQTWDEALVKAVFSKE